MSYREEIRATMLFKSLNAQLLSPGPIIPLSVPFVLPACNYILYKHMTILRYACEIKALSENQKHAVCDDDAGSSPICHSLRPHNCRPPASASHRVTATFFALKNGGGQHKLCLGSFVMNVILSPRFFVRYVPRNYKRHSVESSFCACIARSL